MPTGARGPYGAAGGDVAEMARARPGGATGGCSADRVPLILIVDDEADLVRVLDYNLRKEGFQTEAALGGEEALRKARALRPELVLLDLMLPDVSGSEVCRLIRETP